MCALTATARQLARMGVWRRLMKAQNPVINIVCELISKSSIGFLSTDDSDEYLMPVFASGDVFTPAMLDILLCQSFFAPHVRLNRVPSKQAVTLFFRVCLYCCIAVPVVSHGGGGHGDCVMQLASVVDHLLAEDVAKADLEWDEAMRSTIGQLRVCRCCDRRYEPLMGAFPMVIVAVLVVFSSFS